MRVPGARVLLATALLAGVWGCSFRKSEHPDACEKDADCGGGHVCYQGFCVSTGGDLTGKPCAAGQEPQPCYEGAAGSEGVGVCVGGLRACASGVYTQCLGQVLPNQETCNGRDDDCNAAVDDLAEMMCSTLMMGECQAGMPVCQGSLAFCQPITLAVPEVCNGLDDDCDGMVDDVGVETCYASMADGCESELTGGMTCKGLCHLGTSSCEAGKSTCAGAVTPAPERCTPDGETAADEDCDGLLDESCACTNGAERACYSGAHGTAGVGACRAGTQSCASRVWGACQGEVKQEPESCANLGADDDCNGEQDDIPKLGAPCFDPSKQGSCRSGTWQCAGSALHCVTMGELPELCDAVDQDCDGDGYNGYDLGSSATCGPNCTPCGGDERCCGGACLPVARFAQDEANCGECGRRCASAQFCCQGECTSFDSKRLGDRNVDEDLCRCEQDCGSQSCCEQDCVDLTSDERNCGGCGIRCDSNASCCSGICRSVCLIGIGL
jgi:hypothetical protein